MILICCWPRVPFAIQCLSGVTERPILTIVFNITGLRLATGKLKIRVGQKIKIVSKLSHQDYLFLVNGYYGDFLFSNALLLNTINRTSVEKIF